MLDKIKIFFRIILGWFTNYVFPHNKSTCIPNTNLILLSANLGDAVLFYPYLLRLVDLYEERNQKCLVVCKKSVYLFYTEILGVDKTFFSEVFYEQNWKCVKSIISRYKHGEFLTIYSKGSIYAEAIVANMSARNKVRLASEEELRSINIIFRILEPVLFTKIYRVPQSTWEMNRHKMLFQSVENTNFLSEAPDLIDVCLPSTNLQPPASKYIICCVQSSVSYRSWPEDRWVELAHQLHERYGYEICFTGDRPWDEEERIREPYFYSFCGKTSLSELMVLVKNSHFVVSVDSGVVHLAAALGVTAFCILGNYELYKYFPWQPDVVPKRCRLPVVIEPEQPFLCGACLQRSKGVKKKNQSCYQRAFVNGQPMECLMAVTVDQVLHAISKNISEGFE